MTNQPHPNKILAVRNAAQKVLFDAELAGQISDGQWENSGPWEHWVPWCSAEVIVDPDNLGRTFYARRDSYDFAKKDLLDVVGDRMLAYVQVATGQADYRMVDLRRDLRDLKKIVKMHRTPGLPVPPQPAIGSWDRVDWNGNIRPEVEAPAPTPAPAEVAPPFNTDAPTADDLASVTLAFFDEQPVSMVRLGAVVTRVPLKSDVIRAAERLQASMEVAD